MVAALRRLVRVVRLLLATYGTFRDLDENARSGDDARRILALALVTSRRIVRRAEYEVLMQQRELLESRVLSLKLELAAELEGGQPTETELVEAEREIDGYDS